MDDQKITPKYGDHKNSDDATSPSINNVDNLGQKEQQAADTPAVDGDLFKETSSLPNTPSGSFYKGNLLKLTGRISGSKFGKKGMIGGGAGIVIMLVVAFAALFSFLNVFKLDSLMQNIDQKAFVRLTGATDRRSNKWVASYIAVRLGEVENNRLSAEERTQNNRFFKAASVDTGRPFSDWYRTMRLSKFEADLFTKNGITFTSVVGSDGKVRAGAITFNKEKIPIEISQEDYDKISTEGRDRLATLNKFQDHVDTAIFNSDKEGRTAIRKAVKDNTHSWQVIKRRHIRKDIQNVTGIRDWRFFEKSRDKIDAKKIDMRNKLITKVFPEDANSGKFVRCLFGITDCSNFTNDPGNPENKASSPDPGKVADQTNDVSRPDPNGGVDSNGQPKNIIAQKLVVEDLAKITQQVLLKGVPVLNFISIVGTLEQLKSVDKFITSGAAVQLVSAAKGQQAAALYSTMSIARDQMRTGEASPEEIGAFMELYGNASNSEGFTTVIDPSSNTAKAEGHVMAKDKAAYCDPAHQETMLQPANMVAAEKEFAWQCEDKRVGGESTAKTLEEGYKSTVGYIISPLIEAYDGMTSNIFGQLAVGAATFVEDVIGTALSAILKPTLAMLGIDDKLQEVMGWITAKMMAFMGGGPILDANSPSGQRFNVALNGATVINNASMRSNGAAATTNQTKLVAINTVSEYEKSIDSSFTQKYLALDNPNSLLSHNLFAVANNINTNIAVNFTKIIKGIGSSLTSPFSKSTKAATSPYAADEFSGVDTYDFPQQCYDLDPLTASILDGTNAPDILKKEGIIKSTDELNLTWGMVSNSDSWYQMLYDKVGEKDNAGDIIKQIYNCNLLDNTVRGGLGALNGYAKDNGFADTSAPKPTSATTTTSVDNTSQTGAE